MADTAVAITAGTGTNIDTRTEGTNGNHRQVIVIGDPATNAGVAPVDVTSGLKVNLGADNDVTVTGTVDLGATDNAVLDSIDTAVTTVAAAVSTEMQVDVVGALPAGTNAIGKLAANSGVDIGDVDVTSITNMHSEDFDTGAGTDTTLAVGIAVPASGGAVVVPGDATAGLKVNLGADNDVTVSGTVTANLSATDNAVLDSIDAAVNGTVAVSNAGLTELAAAINTNQLDVNIATDSVGIGGGTQYAVDAALGATPTGTLAIAIRDDALSTLTPVEGDAIGLRVDANGALWTHDDALDAVIAGSEMQVDIVSVTPDLMLGTDFSSVLGTASLVDGSNHLQVDIAADSVGIGGGTQYTEDDIVPANPIGTAMMMERDDVLGGLTPVAGDWTHPFATAEGALWVQDFNSDAILSDTTAILADTANMDTNLGTVAGAVAAGQMQVDIVADGAGLLTTTAHDAAFGTAGTADTQVRSIQGIASMTPVQVGDNSSSLTVDTTGTSGLEVVQVTAGDLNMTEASAAAIKTAVEIIDNSVYVDDADWTADTSSHTLIGGVTQATPTANTDGDTTPLITNSLRELRTAALESDLAAAGTTHVHKYYTAATPTDGIIWSPAAGKRWYLTHLSINVSAASTVTIEDDKTGGDDPVYKAEFAANSGVVLTFPDVPLFSGEDAADLTVTASAGTVYVTAVGYEI